MHLFVYLLVFSIAFSILNVQDAIITDLFLLVFQMLKVISLKIISLTSAL